MITSYIPPECYKCICRVCGQLGCPHRFGTVKRCVRCWEAAHYSPILDCKNFYRKEYPRFRILRRYRSPLIRYVDKTNADDIRVMLTEILHLLRSGSPQMTDVNCIKYDCLCLKCHYFADCQDKCKLCIKYKGQHPVKMCAVKVLRDKSSKL